MYRVYNLEVEGAHPYFVGRAQVLAHNAGCAPDVDAMAAAADAPDRNGLTYAGRSLDKHGAGTRPGSSAYPAPAGNVAAKNAMGSFQAQDILTHPNATFSPLGRGGMEVAVPDGRFMRFNADGSFAYFDER